MTDLWYYAHDEHKMGPFSGQQLKDLAACGRILPTDTVWKEGVEKGASARKVKGLLFPPAHTSTLTVSHGAPPTEVSSSQPPAGTPSPVGITPAVASATPPSPDAKADPAALRLGRVPAESMLGGGTVRGSEAPAMFPAVIELDLEEKAPAALDQPSPQRAKVKKRRAVAVQGAAIVGQDGITVRYRKKCTACGHVDSYSNTMAITDGVMRATFFCPKCRKSRGVTIQGSLG